MVNVNTKPCNYEGCNTIPNYNLPGVKGGLYCEIHALPGMIDVKNKKCLEKNCNVRPSYNISGSKNGIYCINHKLNNMINVNAKLCNHPGCTTHATYNSPNEKTRLYCSIHKLPEMIQLSNNHCIVDNCIIESCYNLPGTKIGLYCNTHKLDNMINVKDQNKLCIYDGCVTIPSYNLPSEKKGLYCKEHKLDKMVDVINKICVTIDCKTRASYGKLFQSKAHCAKHKNLNEYLKNWPKCEEENCKVDPYYADKGNYPERCETHKLETDQNIIETTCNICEQSYYINTDLGVCNGCDLYYGKDKKIRNPKEERIKDVLLANNIEFVSHDKTIEYACSKKRPDFIIDRPLFTLILEVDENQHMQYVDECESSRMILIHKDFGGTPVVFIRYNPDKYIDYEGKTKRAAKKRETKLIDLINGLDNRTEWEIPLSAYYMYYDGYQEGIDELQTLVSLERVKELEEEIGISYHLI
jgi:hypothetical protein